MLNMCSLYKHHLLYLLWEKHHWGLKHPIIKCTVTNMEICMWIERRRSEYYTGPRNKNKKCFDWSIYIWKRVLVGWPSFLWAVNAFIIYHLPIQSLVIVTWYQPGRLFTDILQPLNHIYAQLKGKPT